MYRHQMSTREKYYSEDRLGVKILGTLLKCENMNKNIISVYFTYFVKKSAYSDMTDIYIHVCVCL
jgi:hypothetical protein